VEPARPKENIAERTPTSKEVEQAVMRGKCVGEPMTWATIVQNFALPEFTRGSPPRIQRDVLPLALKHQGLVVLRQRANAKGRKGFLYPYMAPWINRDDDRALFVEKELACFHAEQAQDSLLLDRFSGGPASSRGRLTAADVCHLAHEKYDRFLARIDAEEAAAPEREQRAAVARQLEANAEAIRQAHLAAAALRTTKTKTRVVRAAASSSSSDSSSSSSDDDDASDAQ
jgi:hypothetical protein